MNVKASQNFDKILGEDGCYHDASKLQSYFTVRPSSYYNNQPGTIIHLQGAIIQQCGLANQQNAYQNMIGVQDAAIQKPK